METTLDPQQAYITKIGASHVVIDEGGNRMEFLDSRFYQTEDGPMVPSVTTILDAWPKGAQYYEWLKKHGEHADEIRDDAGRRGSVVHNLTEQFDRGEEVCAIDKNGSALYSRAEWAMFERYVEFVERFKPEMIAIELNLASAELGYGGTLDRLMRINDELWLVDIKTSGAVYDHYHLQTVAYANLLMNADRIDIVDWAGLRRGILWLNAKTRTEGKGDAIQGPGWQMVESARPIEKDEELFNACQQIWKVANENIKPKNIIYKLKHKKQWD